MSVQVENLEKSMAKLTVTVSAEDFEKALQRAYQKQKKNISIPKSAGLLNPTNHQPTPPIRA